MAACKDASAHITADSGKEFAGFAVVDAAMVCQTCFANTHAAWECGLCECTCGLRRHGFARGRDLRTVAAARVAWVQAMPGNWPRNILDGRTPRELIER